MDIPFFNKTHHNMRKKISNWTNNPKEILVVSINKMSWLRLVTWGEIEGDQRNFTADKKNICLLLVWLLMVTYIELNVKMNFEKLDIMVVAVYRQKLGETTITICNLSMVVNEPLRSN